jgi:hypothetical protein
MQTMKQVRQAIECAINDLLQTPDHVVSSRMLVSSADGYNSLRALSLGTDINLLRHDLPTIAIDENDSGVLTVEQTRSQIIERYEHLKSVIS